MGLGDFITGLFGSKNKSNAGDQTGAPEVDPNAYNYGGDPGGAAAHAAAYGATSGNAQNRQGVGVDYSQANWDRQNSGQARVGQQQLADAMSRRAMGQVPSIAQMQADRQMQQAQAAQASMQGSARGAGALANAQRNAANNVATAHGAISGQAQINAANERLAAEQAASGAYGNMRGQDLGSQAQAAQQAQYAAQLQDAQRARNDQMSLGYSQLENQVNTTQLGAHMNQQAQTSANKLGAAGINAGVGGQNAAMNQSNAVGAINMIGQSAGAFATAGGSGGGTPPPKAKGGPVQGRHPYLVGEEAPELVVPDPSHSHNARPYLVGLHGAELMVPKHDGTVIPAAQTAQILRSARAEGGPVEAGGAPTTWGNVQATPGDVQGLEWNQAQNAALAQAMRESAQYENPYARDVREVRALRALNPELVNEQDNERYRRGNAYLRLGQHPAAAPATEEQAPKEAPKADAEKKAVTEGKALPKNPSMRDRATSGLGALTRAMGDQAKGIDVSYHGPGGSGYVPPHLIPVARAMGGPIQAGGDPGADIASLTGFRPVGPSYGGGSGTVDIGGQSGISGAQVRAASTGLAGGVPIRGMVGGGGITGGGGVPGGFGAREDGGPVKAGGYTNKDEAKVFGAKVGAGTPGSHLQRRAAMGERPTSEVSADEVDRPEAADAASDADRAADTTHLIASPIAGFSSVVLKHLFGGRR